MISINDAIRFREHCKANDYKIVFSNGCFDLFHLGHWHLLQQASRYGGIWSKLIVGVNSDASYVEVKGREPVFNEETRREMVELHPCVELAFVFDNPSVLETVEGLRPDFLIKGGDYRLDQVVGWEVVQGYGGEVAALPHAHMELTTTKIIERCKEL